jgi:3-phosphoshikimate 1-carboxyvinyltransferase
MSNLAIHGPTKGFEGTLVAPPSKYYTHRAFILGSLAEGESMATGTAEALDNVSTVRAIGAFGTRVERIAGGYKIRGGPYQTPDNIIDVGNSGTTMQFLLGLASTAPGTTVLTGDGSIRQRPLGPLLEALNRWGVECWSSRGNGLPPVVVKPFKELKPAVESVGTISQWISGLILLAPFAGKDAWVHVQGGLNEPTYVATTLHCMKLFGIDVQPSDDFQSFLIPAGQKYKPAQMHIPGDFALAANGLVLAAHSDSHVRYENLDMASVQAEKGVIPILQRMGADLRIDNHKKTIELFGGKPLKGIEVDANDTPDIVPIITLLLALAKGKSRIYNAAQVRLKECDRLAAMTQLNKMGAKIIERPDGLDIEGVDRLHGAQMDSLLDHRVQMTFVLAGLLAQGTTSVSDAEVAAISYPGFLEDMRRLGLGIEVVD